MAKNDCLVSVIVPIYNVEAYVEECIESIIKQSYHNLEILLVNDGSTDNSDIICKKYAKKDVRVRVVEQEHGGLSRARNTGIEEAQGDYFAFVDSDDWIEPCMIERLLVQIQCHSADIACCNFEKFDNKLKKEHRVAFNGQSVYTRQEALERFLLEDYFMCYAWNKLYRANLFENVRYPEDKAYEDIITIYKIIQNSKKIVFCSESYYHYRVRMESITNSKFNDKHYDMIHAIRHIRKQEENRHIWLGCAIYYLYFLDDMIRDNLWDWDIYQEFRSTFLAVTKTIKVSTWVDSTRCLQLYGCCYAVHIYRILYKMIHTLRGKYA